MTWDLNPKIPSGPIDQKWTRRQFEMKLVNPANKRRYRVIVVGTGLAGASAAATMAELGYEVDALIGRPFEELYPEDQRQVLARQIEGCFEQQETLHRWEARIAHRDGSTLWVRTTARIVVAEDGEPSLLIVCEDLTETRTLSEILNYESSHDSLTGLLNRREFERRLVEALRSAAATRSEHALCYVDLNQFQLVNESWGPEAGDDLLRRIARLFPRMDGRFWLDLTDVFISENLGLVAQRDRKGKEPGSAYHSELHLRDVDNIHYSPAGSRLWAKKVAERAVLVWHNAQRL